MNSLPAWYWCKALSSLSLRVNNEDISILYIEISICLSIFFPPVGKRIHIYSVGKGLMYEVDAKHNMGHNNILKKNILKYRGLLQIKLLFFCR